MTHLIKGAKTAVGLMRACQLAKPEILWFAKDQHELEV